MLDFFSRIDTPLEYAQSATGVVLVFIGFGLGTRLGQYLYQSFLAILFLGILIAPIWAIANDILVDWKSIGLGSVGLGLAIGLVLFPLSAISAGFGRLESLEERIEAIEQLNDIDLSQSDSEVFEVKMKAPEVSKTDFK
ncbi:MAG: hypothetical protein AAGB01_08975 [Cyanobacteria bacterium P01_F01_bin.42]